MLYVARKIRFSAAHFFYLPELSEAENLCRFGPSSNRKAHGHNYQIELTVKGPLDPATGMVMNLKDLKEILVQEVVEPMDFRNLNLEIPFFQDHLPSLESMVLLLWEPLKARVAEYGLALESLRAEENDDLFVEFYGEFAA